MTWQDLGSIGELVSGIAVVISLVYVAYQIRQNSNQINQNTKAVRAAAIDSSISHTMRIRTAIFESEGVARIFHAGGTDPEGLPEVELMRYRLVLHNILDSLSNTFHQSRYAELSDYWDARIPITQRVLSTAGGKWFWSLFGKEFDGSFQDEVRRICPDFVDPGEAARTHRPPAA